MSDTGGAAAAEQGAASGAGQAGAAAAARPTWYDGLDTELKGHVQRTGWDKLDPAAAAAAAAKSHREAELHFQRTLNIPRDEFARIPKDPADPAMAEVWKRLGTPESADAYKFDDIKFAGGEPLEPEAQADLRTAFHEAKLTPQQAAVIAKHVTSMADKSDAAEKAATATAAGAATAQLDAAWGANKDVNTFLAQKAQGALKLPASWLTPQLDPEGYPARMEALRMLGATLGNPAFLQGQPSPTTGGGMTYEMATARKAELMADKAWGKRWFEGDKAAQNEMAALDETIARGRVGGPQ